MDEHSYRKPRPHLPTKEDIAQYEDVWERFPRAPQEKKLWTPAFTTGVAIIAVGILLLLIRFIFGLGSITNLSSGFPWGLWIAFDVVVGIALASGGFVTAALVYIFNLGKYSPLVRPALVTALLGYAMAAFGVFIDVGRWWQLYNPVLPWHWQGSSALFEVALCVMSYLLVLIIEFAPTVIDKLSTNKDSKLKRFAIRIRPILEKVMILFIILGVVISTMHQSSLGSIMLLMSHRLHALWFTPWLPLLFLMSAIAVGMHVVIVESMLSAKTFGRRIEMPLLSGLAKRSIAFLGLYVIIKLMDLIWADEFTMLFTSWWGLLWWVEVLLFGMVPVFLLSFKAFRRDPRWLFWISWMVIGGLILNRFNVYLFAVQAYDGWTYFPTMWEVIVSASIVAFIFVGYKYLSNKFPVLHKEEGLAKA
ncbi:Ni/Fe-hydrogenase cytochrome b subunit [bacterium]|nr:Ni/Fe-hydrogenase cytochrome b subunit [bacterium]